MTIEYLISKTYVVGIKPIQGGSQQHMVALAMLSYISHLVDAILKSATQSYEKSRNGFHLLHTHNLLHFSPANVSSNTNNF